MAIYNFYLKFHPKKFKVLPVMRADILICRIFTKEILLLLIIQLFRFIEGIRFMTIENSNATSLRETANKNYSWMGFFLNIFKHKKFARKSLKRKKRIFINGEK